MHGSTDWSSRRRNEVKESIVVAKAQFHFWRTWGLFVPNPAAVSNWLSSQRAQHSLSLMGAVFKERARVHVKQVGLWLGSLSVRSNAVPYFQQREQ